MSVVLSRGKAFFLVITVSLLAASVLSIPNPASVFCASRGGTVEVRKDSEGNEYGVCVFKEGVECGEWDYYRGSCRPGVYGYARIKGRVLSARMIPGIALQLEINVSEVIEDELGLLKNGSIVNVWIDAVLWSEMEGNKGVCLEAESYVKTVTERIERAINNTVPPDVLEECKGFIGGICPPLRQFYDNATQFTSSYLEVYGEYEYIAEEFNFRMLDKECYVKEIGNTAI